MPISVSQVIKAIKQRDHRALAQAITLLESKQPGKRELGQQILDSLHNPSHKSHKVAFTGPPGAGKSSLIEGIGLKLTEMGASLAVLTIDPSSPLRGGSILADKIRMQKLSTNPNAYIRPSASGKGYLGGINAATVDVIDLIDAVGYDFILVETIGVGQNEVDIKDLVDKVVLVLPPASGDGLQGLKKGLNEIIDIIVVNKHDGDFKKSAELTAMNYQAALNLSSEKVPVHLCSASEGTGIDDMIELLQKIKISPGKRLEQRVNLFEKIALEEVIHGIVNDPSYQKALAQEKKLLQDTPQSLRRAIKSVLKFYKH